MKKIILLLVIIGSMSIQSCFKDYCTSHQTYVRLDPIYKTVEAIRNEYAVSAGRELKNPGKIYTYNNYLLINETYEGIHIFDNSNPRHPVNLAFITIAGNRDMAVKANVLYADNGIDFLAIDISDVTAPKILKRLNAVFNRSYGWSQTNAVPILVGYNKTNITQVIDCSSTNFGQSFFPGVGGLLWANADVLKSGGAFGVPATVGGVSSIGVGGSQSRFGIVDKYLYAIDQSDLHVIYIDDPKSPREGKSLQVSWNIETLFPYKDKLFIGAQNGMYIMDNSNPEAPSLLSTFTHARSCDPVYVDGDLAYITLSDGTTCQNFTNELDVVDISNITAPRLLNKFPMQHPQGLSILNNTLYLCEGKYGFKIFDANNKQTIDQHLLTHLTGITAYDVIALGASQIIVVGESGLTQLDASDPKSVKTLSIIPITKN
jgi:hypothetical protein